jgi:hypothetical protein
MFTDKELINLPHLIIGIPVQHNAAACLTHMLRSHIGNIRISLEDLRIEGATLILSSHIQLQPEWQVEQLDHNAQCEQEEKMKHLNEFWDNYMEEQKEKLGLNNPLTLEQIERSLKLIEQGKIKFADNEYWSNETKKYNEAFEKDLEDYSVFDSLTLWGGDDVNEDE